MLRAFDWPCVGIPAGVSAEMCCRCVVNGVDVGFGFKGSRDPQWLRTLNI